MDSTKSTNGKMSRQLLQVLMIVAMAMYIIVKDVVVPLVGEPRSERQSIQADTTNERLARLEECVLTLRPLPAEIAGLKATVDSMRSSVTRLENKVDHLGK